MEDPDGEPRVTDDVGTAREWAEETGAAPVRTGRERGPSDQVALVPDEEAEEFERLDWSAFGRVLHDSEKVVRYDGTGDVEDLAVVHADEVPASARYEATRDASFEEREVEGKQYAEHEMRGVGASGAKTDEDHGDEAVRERRPDRSRGTAPSLDQDDVGKTVVDEEGTELGVVAQASGTEGAVHVDAHPNVAERIMSKLGWTGEEDVDYEIPPERIVEVTDDEVVLASGDIETAGE